MTRPTLVFIAPVAAVIAAALIAGCASESADAARTELTAACVDDLRTLPDAEWVCPEDMQVECVDGMGNHDVVFTPPPNSEEPLACADLTVAVDDPGPFPLGENEVTVTATVEGEEPVEVCRADLRVVDTLPPEVIEHDPAPMWPPHHDMHRVTVEDCVTVDDLCDEDVEAWFTWVTSDEPADDTGDGNTAPDVRVLSCGEVDLRAERLGGSDGRVYTLGWAAMDDDGHMVDGTCRVTVPHDQGGAPATAGAPAYRMDVCPR